MVVTDRSAGAGAEQAIRSVVTSPRITCTICSSTDVFVLRRSEEIARDLAAANRGLDAALHAAAVDVFACRSCASVCRDPEAIPGDLERRYREANFAPEALRRLSARRRADIERDANWFRAQGVRRGARVLEIGSYVGAFLDFAVANGCRAIGYDLGQQVSKYCRRRGLHIVTGPFQPPPRARPIYDAVFVLNCFEQLADPARVLGDAVRVLRPGGRLVIRTPNAAFVRLVHEGHRPVFRSLADANAVLGVPFIRCFSARALFELLSEAGLDVCELRGHEFTSQMPAGHSWAWSCTRSIRAGAFALAATIRGERLDPWLDVSAVGRGVTPARSGAPTY